MIVRGVGWMVVKDMPYSDDDNLGCLGFRGAPRANLVILVRTA